MKHILIVDDNKTNLVSAKNALAEDYKVTAVTSGEQALRFLNKNMPDLILLDINMPEMDGFEVLEHIKNNSECSHIPVIFLTGDNDPVTETRCLESGAQDFVVKPFVPTVMRSRIARILELEELRKSLANRLDEKIKEVSDMKSKSLQDALTGLWNRAYTEDAVGRLMQGGVKGCLFMMDMDNFKVINDRYGHLAGDHTLKTFAQIIQKYASPEDVVCRIGGDEFMTFVTGEKTKEEFGRHAEQIIQEMAVFFEENKFETNSSVSVGMAIFPEDGEDFASLYSAADKALYHVKQNGKNTYHFYSDQNAKENERAGKAMDLNYLRDIMHRSDASKGSYILDFDSFHHVYNFIRRSVERNNRNVQTVLYTLKAEFLREDPTEIERAMELLENAIISSLRRVDVSARYSNRQMVVILVDTDEEHGKTVAERILKDFEKLYDGKLSFEFDILNMGEIH